MKVARGRAPGICVRWQGTRKEVDAWLSSTTRNTASGRKPLVPSGLRAAQAHLLRCPSSTMLQYDLRRVALHLDPRRPQRDPWDFHHGLLVLTSLETGGFRYPGLNRNARTPFPWVAALNLSRVRQGW